MKDVQLETYEWIRTWVDHANAKDLPRVLLIGDSITNGYQEAVRELLCGVCYVDFIATSYYCDNPTYTSLVRMIYESLPYAVVHFNHGLHGYHGDVEGYRAEMERLALELSEKSKVILVTSTNVKKSGELTEIHEGWEKRLSERNAALADIAEKNGFRVNDLYAVSLSIPLERRSQDGVHYLTDGYKENLAPVVAEAIRAALA